MTTTNTVCKTSAHPRCIHKTSEFLGIIICMVAYNLQKQYPLTLYPYEASETWPALCGYLLVATSAYILRRTLLELAMFDQPHEPGKPTTALVTTGPFYYSRNPTYTAIIFLLQPGLALIFDSAWMIVLLPVLPILFWYVMIKDEEIYLHQKFGPKWEEYCHQTPRWVAPKSFRIYSK